MRTRGKPAEGAEPRQSPNCPEDPTQQLCGEVHGGRRPLKGTGLLSKIKKFTLFHQILAFSGAGLPGSHGLRYAAKQHSYSFTGLHQSPYEQFGKYSIGVFDSEIWSGGLWSILLGGTKLAWFYQ